MNLELAIAILLKNTFCILLLSCIFSTFISCSQKHSDTTVVGSMTLFLFHVAKYYGGVVLQVRKNLEIWRAPIFKADRPKTFWESWVTRPLETSQRWVSGSRRIPSCDVNVDGWLFGRWRRDAWVPKGHQWCLQPFLDCLFWGHSEGRCDRCRPRRWDHIHNIAKDGQVEST